jgi:hypothetical protein
MLYARDPQLTILADKLRARDYIRNCLGEAYLVPLLWSGTDPAMIPYDTLPQSFVIKTTHGCGYNLVIPAQCGLDRKAVKDQLAEWMRRNYCDDHMLGAEWCYRHISPAILVEAMLEENGRMPVDFKLFCFSGRVEFVQVDYDRFAHHSRRLFDRHLSPLDIELGYPQHPSSTDLPGNAQQMFSVAEALAADIEFVRVDLYSVGGRIYVGELSIYPGAGSETFRPREWDYVWGAKWKPPQVRDAPTQDSRRG